VSEKNATSAVLLREARSAVHLSQTELAKRAGVAQSVISAYESGRREPALSTLRRLIEATGLNLVTTLEPSQRVARGLPDTEMGARIRQRRRAILAIAKKYGAGQLTVFGSVARGEDGPQSDIDIVAALPTSMGLVAMGGLVRELSDLLGRKVDLVPRDGLRAHVQHDIENEGIPL